jgi:hypothetical protein
MYILKKFVKSISNATIAIYPCIFLIVLYTCLLGSCNTDRSWIIKLEIKGRLSQIENNRGVVKFMLQGDRTNYSIMPYARTESPRELIEFVKVGDSVFKRMDSDSIYIVKDSQVIGWYIPAK